MIKTICFLGYSKKKTRLINFFKKKKFKVKNIHNRYLNKKNASEADLIVSFGYKKIISKKILTLTKRPIINLHISFLPYNRGAHPNFWSFFDNTPKGVSIHEINSKIDSGNLIFRKRIKFKKIKKQSFRSTYKILIKEVENLFFKNFQNILKRNYLSKKISFKGSFHKKKDLPKSLKNWNVNIFQFLKNYKK
tara:strand:+ start:46 stop:621 length:576 start_codon:yes stop_codon:yes gene_type:complete